MVTCPSCGHEVEKGEFCSNCGASLRARGKKGQAQGPAPAVITRIDIVLAAMSVLILASIGLLALAGLFQAPARISVSVKNQSMCGGSLAYSVELTSDSGRGYSDQEIDAYANGALFESLITDQNGRLSSAKDIPPAWCGKRVQLAFVYSGDMFHKNASAHSSVAVKIPTSLQISVPDRMKEGIAAAVNVTLGDSARNLPVAGRSVDVTNSASENAVTDSNGFAQVFPIFNETGVELIMASFRGDDAYLPSDSPLREVIVVPRACSDGTLVNQCAKATGYYCNGSEQLVFDCSTCGCGQGLVCGNNSCITQEQQMADLVATLQKSVVYVADSFESGSGVVIAQNNGKTAILTNEHVVADAVSIGDVKIKTSDQRSASASDIRIAPRGMDLAVIYLNGIYGEPAQANYSSHYPLSEQVLALGSPEGIQGTVSQGIISNYVPKETGSGYKFNEIQTDAAITHGNSGGGLFTIRNGDLIGINSEGLVSQFGQGVSQTGFGFAIDIDELGRLGSYDNWAEFTPIPRCADSTPYGNCSDTNAGYYCSGGNLVSMCSVCGCGSGAICQSDDQCFSCPSGYATHRDANGDGFCCQPGYTAYIDTDGSGFCCPPGTAGYTGGSCQ